MRSLALLAALLGLSSATPTPTQDEASLDARTIAKRATITDACTVGFCTQNGGTTGGTGGTTVSSISCSLPVARHVYEKEIQRD